MIDVGVIDPGFYGIRGALNEVMNLAADARLVQIYLHIPGVEYLLALRAVGDLFTPLFDHADRQQMIAWNHLRSGAGRTRLNTFSDISLRSVDPGDAIPRRRLVTQTL